MKLWVECCSSNLIQSAVVSNVGKNKTRALEMIVGAINLLRSLFCLMMMMIGNWNDGIYANLALS